MSGQSNKIKDGLHRALAGQSNKIKDEVCKTLDSSKENSSPNKENGSPNFKTITPGDGRTYEYYWYRHQPESVFIGFLNLGIGSGIVKPSDTMVDVAELFSCTGDQARMVLSIANDLLETNEDIN